MKKFLSLNTLVCFAAIFVVYVVDLLLIKNNFLQSSILVLLDKCPSFRTPTNHVFVHALIPVYIAVISFSACLLGALIGLILHRIFFIEKEELIQNKREVRKN